MSKFFLIKNEIKQMLSLCIPFMGAQFIYSSSFFIGTAMIARLGKEALAASVLVTSFWITLTTFFIGILTSVSILVAHQYGAKNDKAIRKIMEQAFLLGMMICVLDILLLIILPFFLHWITQPPEVLHIAKQYLQALPWCVPGMLILMISGQFLGSIGHSRIVFRVSVLVVLLELPIMYLLIFGKWGLPALGVAGIGYAYAVTNTIASIGLICYLKKSKTYQHFGIFSHLSKVNFHLFKEFIRIGLPMGFMHLIEVGTFTLATFWIAQFGATWLAAHQIALQYLTFFITTIVFSMSQTVSIRVGHAVGCQDRSVVERAITVGMLMSFLIMTVVAWIFYAFPELLLRVDLKVNDPANALLVKNASDLLSICALLFLFDNFRMIGFGALRGLKDTRFPMIASFFSFFCVALGLAYFLGFTLDLKGNGIWWGLTSGIAVGSILILIRLKYYLQRIDLTALLRLR